MMVAALSVGVPPGSAQSTDQAQSADKNWGTECSASVRNAPLDCSVFQQVVDANSGRVTAMLRVRVPGDTKSPVMLVQMPLGVYLPGQLTMSIDNAAPTAIAFQTCDVNGCYAGTPVPPNFLAAMEKGQTLSLQVQNQARQASSVGIVLAGFAKAYAAIQ